MRKVWHDKAWEEYLYWQTQDKKTLKKNQSAITRHRQEWIQLFWKT